MIPVLDSGYVKLIEFWGSDERFIEAARMSTNKGFEGWETDAKLLKFLYKNNHMTPFEMGGLVLEVKAPIFVFREWHRHRVPFSYNEMSARYTPLPNENYLPSATEIWNRMQAQTANKQAQGAGTVGTPAHVELFLEQLRQAYALAQFAYEFGLAHGIPKELARLSVPVARYSRMRVSSNVRGWMNFLQLRMAMNAQAEIRAYANAVHTIFQEKFPRTAELFDGR